MNEREKIIRLWFDMWLKQQDLGMDKIFTEDVVYTERGILSDIQSGELALSGDYEDIHTFVEVNLIQRIGEVGKKLHTGRSRNDQVAVDMRLYARRCAEELHEKLEELVGALSKTGRENDCIIDRKSTRLNSSHSGESRMPSSA